MPTRASMDRRKSSTREDGILALPDMRTIDVCYATTSSSCTKVCGQECSIMTLEHNREALLSGVFDQEWFVRLPTARILRSLGFAPTCALRLRFLDSNVGIDVYRHECVWGY